MFDHNHVVHDTAHFPAIVEVTAKQSDNLGLLCRIYHQNGWCDAKTWLSLQTTPPYVLHWGWATTLALGEDQTDVLLLGLRENPDQPLATLLSDSWCPIPNIVSQTTALIDDLLSQPLHQFMTRALLHWDAMHGYWQSPASRRNHHAYPGGLAQHSLEVATMLVTSSGLTQEDRELGTAFALLHDYGKIWCYTPDAVGRVDSRQHEAIGLTELEPGLLHLRGQDERLGALMEELLGGRRTPREGRYPLAIGQIVRSFDQMSCEMSRRVSPKASDMSWLELPI